MSLFDWIGRQFGGGDASAGGLLASAPTMYNPGIGLQAMFMGGQMPQQPPSPMSPSVDPSSGATANQQKWMDAISGISAALRDAGAYMQHQPEAAGNVAAFINQRQQRMKQQAISDALTTGVLGTPAPDGQMFATPPNPATGLNGFSDSTGGLLPPAQADQMRQFIKGMPPEIATPFLLQLAQKQLEPQAPIKVGQGDVLLDQHTYQPLYTAPAEADFQEKNYGVNPATGKLDTYVIDRRTGKTQWLNIPPKPDIDIVNNQAIDKNAIQPGTVIAPAPYVPLTPQQIQDKATEAAAVRTAENNTAGARLSEPKVVEADDGQGGKMQVLAQQDKQSGQWVTGDQNRTPLTNVNLMPTTPQGRVAAQVIRIATGALTSRVSWRTSSG
jgi:hypothetical protein